LDKYRIDYVLLQPKRPLGYLLEHSPACAPFTPIKSPCCWNARRRARVPALRKVGVIFTSPSPVGEFHVGSMRNSRVLAFRFWSSVFPLARRLHERRIGKRKSFSGVTRWERRASDSSPVWLLGIAVTVVLILYGIDSGSRNRGWWRVFRISSGFYVAGQDFRFGPRPASLRLQYPTKSTGYS